MTLAPDALPRRSFVYRELVALGATFGEIAGAACALEIDGADEAARAESLALCDLSPLPRAGYKGRDTRAWLGARGIRVPEEDNRALRQDDGWLAARLAPGEVLLLAGLDGDPATADRLAADWSPDPDPGTYPVPRTDTNCWFAITGRHGAEMMAKLCGVDLRPHKFPDGAIAQTSVARLNAIVLRADLGATVAYHLLTDSASASYMWSCVIDAMAEYDGAIVGLAALRSLAGRT